MMGFFFVFQFQGWINILPFDKYFMADGDGFSGQAGILFAPVTDDREHYLGS
jgi:hypothetical protein